MPTPPRAAYKLDPSEALADPVALERLFEQYAPLVRALSRQLAAPGVEPDDLFQDAFVLIWRKLHAQRGPSMRAWITGVVVRVAAAANRRVWLRKHLRLDAIAPLPDWRTPEGEAARSEEARILKAALEQMSDKRRTVFVLFELNGLGGQEIAMALRCPLKTVHTRLFHARKDFARYVREYRARAERAEGGD